MWSLTRLRQHPNFANLFAHVHPFCWLILWWELNRLMRWYRKRQPEDALVSTSPWGFITVTYIVDRADPNLYRPVPRTFRPLTDASWESGLPACLTQDELAPPHALILPRACGRWPEGSEGALRSPLCDSS